MGSPSEKETRTTQSSNALVVTTPGRLQLLGNFCPLYGGSTLHLNIDLSTTVQIESLEESMVRFYSPELKEKKKTSLGPIKYRKEDRWANSLKGGLLWAQKRGLVVGKALFSVEGDLPKDVGLGASQSLALAALEAANQFYQWNLEPQDLVQGAWWVESNFLGRRVSQSEFLLFLESRKDSLVHSSEIPLQSQSFHLEPKLYILISSLPRSSFEMAHEDHYTDCLQALEKLGWRKDITGLELDQDQVRTALPGLPISVRRRCRFLLEEQQRTRDALDCLKENNWSALGKLMNRSHDGLRDLYEVSCPEIDWLVKRCQEVPEVLGAKIVGEGVGKSIAVLAHDDLQPLLESVLSEYERIFGFQGVLVPIQSIPGFPS